MAAKRPIVVEGNTPGKPDNKRPPTQGTSRKSLFQEGNTAKTSSSNRQWSVEETSALVQHICLFSEEAWMDRWPTRKDPEFWDACANSVNKICKSSRTGSSCRSRTTKHLSKQFKSLSEAEETLNIDYILNSFGYEESGSTPQRTVIPDDALSPIFSCSPAKNTQPLNTSVGDMVREFLTCFKSSMSSRLRTQLLYHIFKLTVVEDNDLEFFKFVNSDFLSSSVSAMKVLYKERKHNLIFQLSKCLEGSSPRMPLDRMPYGLIDYNIRFFASNRTQKLGMEKHYSLWLETMFSQFGHKWLCLHRGPVWQYDLDTVTEGSLQGNLEDKSTDVDGAEMDIIQHALQQAALSFELEEGNNTLDTINTSLSSMCMASNGVPTCSSPITDEDNLHIEENVIPSSDLCDPGEVVHVSHLWNCVSDNERLEMELGLVSSQEMERFHSIQPNMSTNARRNPWMFNPLKSKVNIASLGVREIQKRIASSGFSRTVDVQMEALKQAKESNPQGRWWIKADGCDVRKGLRESMRGSWAGDEDLGDGSLQVLFEGYKTRCMFVKSIGSTRRSSLVSGDIQKVLLELESDLEFLAEGAEAANIVYRKALQGGKASEHKMMELSWSAVGFDELTKKLRGFQRDLKDFLQESGEDNDVNLISMKSSLLHYLKDLYSKKRIAASHLLVFMISDELRNRKPYAIPVRFLPYRSLTDAKLRELEVQLEEAMRSTGMTVVGFTTDGEFNSLRTVGNVRPISIIELIKNARNDARRMSANTIASILRMDRQGNVIRQHPAVPLQDVMWLNTFMANGGSEPISFEHATLMLRRKLFPFMHNPHPWVGDRSETAEEVLKSIMAIYLYRKKIDDLKHHVSDPANFSENLYQPEKDANGELIHHREDHNHLLKRIVARLREGFIPGVNLQYLRDALHDPSTGLTYEALTGKNKQSVPDCERLINPGVISFLERKGHTSEAHVLRLIHNWHKAVDGRGLSEEQRSSYCRNMKEWLLADWMPWFCTLPDYSTIDVNR